MISRASSFLPQDHPQSRARPNNPIPGVHAAEQFVLHSTNVLHLAVKTHIDAWENLVLKTIGLSYRYVNRCLWAITRDPRDSELGGCVGSEIAPKLTAMHIKEKIMFLRDVRVISNLYAPYVIPHFYDEAVSFIFPEYKIAHTYEA